MITIKDLSQETNVRPEKIRKILRSNGLGVGKGSHYEWEENPEELGHVRDLIKSYILRYKNETPVYTYDGVSFWSRMIPIAFTRRFAVIASFVIIGTLADYSLARPIVELASLYLSIEIIVWLFRFIFGSNTWEGMPGRTPQVKLARYAGVLNALEGYSE